VTSTLAIQNRTPGDSLTTADAIRHIRMIEQTTTSQAGKFQFLSCSMVPPPTEATAEVSDGRPALFLDDCVYDDEQVVSSICGRRHVMLSLDASVGLLKSFVSKRYFHRTDFIADQVAGIPTHC
jgi:hypothetical protein